MALPIAGLAGLVQREAGAAAGGLAARVAFAAVAGLCVVVALGFLVASATVALADEHGAVMSTAIVGAAFLAIALVVLVVSRLRERRRHAALARMRAQRAAVFHEVAARSTLDAALGLMGVSVSNRVLLVPIAAGVALGWFAERRARRRYWT